MQSCPLSTTAKNAKAVGGGAGASGRSLIQVSHDFGTPCGRGVSHPMVWVAVIGGFVKSGSSNVFLDCTFPSPGNGRLVTMRCSGSTTLHNSLFSQGIARNDGVPRNIRVEFIN
jgi:hypothetical protein